ncbi:YcaO-like family protein [candidate division WOR-3 bacterium]|nr:YcaO-like family protein [candidate division WOR-3 bacterium]
MKQVGSVNLVDCARWERLKVAIDSEAGIVKQLIPGMLASDDPAIFSYAGVMANTKSYNAHQCNQRNGGAGFSDIQARVSALGECLERYCASFYESEKLVLASWKDLGNEAVHPAQWCLFDQQQHESFRSLGWDYAPFTEDTRLCWVRGWSLTGECPRYVPAQVVYIPYSPVEGEAVISPSISTGMAFGCSWNEALCYGLYEHFERDALSLWWLARLPVPNIDLDDRAAGDLRSAFSATVSRIWLKYAKLDFDIHVIIVLGLATIRMASGERKKTLMMGSSARLDPGHALSKAFLEMGQGAPFHRFLLDRNPSRTFCDDLRDLLNFDDHPYYWLSNTERMLPGLDFLSAGGLIRMESLDNLDRGADSDNVEYLVTMLKRRNIEAVVVDLTTPDVDSIGGKVCKVIIPSFQPLEGAHLLRHLGGERLWSVPVGLGYYPERLSPDHLNPLPHPSA